MLRLNLCKNVIVRKILRLKILKIIYHLFLEYHKNTILLDMAKKLIMFHRDF